MSKNIAPNWRNAAGTQNTNLMTSVDGTYQVGTVIRLDWGVTVFKRSLTTGQVTETFDLSSVPALVTYGITPVVSEILGGDDHNGISCGIDDQNRMWVCGNSRGFVIAHMIVSAPNSISSWTAIASPWPWWSRTSPWGNYSRFLRMGDGRLLHFFTRRDDAGHDEGLEQHAFILPLGGSTTSWQPLVGTGLMFNSDYGSVPERVYTTGAFVEGPLHPHPDRVWVSGAWRDVWNDGSTQHDAFVLYNDTVTNSATWKRIDGTTHPMPVEYATTISSTATVPMFGNPYWFPSWNMLVDRQGHPHLFNFPSAGTNHHVWHDGAAWTYETSGSGHRATLHILPNGQVVKYFVSGGRPTVTWINGTHPFKLGGPVPTGTAESWFETFGDPIQLQNGVLHIVVPDGDTPRVFTFGDHAHARAS